MGELAAELKGVRAEPARVSDELAAALQEVDRLRTIADYRLQRLVRRTSEERRTEVGPPRGQSGQRVARVRSGAVSDGTPPVSV
jgi:hypothetical protein